MAAQESDDEIKRWNIVENKISYNTIKRNKTLSDFGLNEEES